MCVCVINIYIYMCVCIYIYIYVCAYVSACVIKSRIMIMYSIISEFAYCWTELVKYSYDKDAVSKSRRISSDS